MDELAPSLHAAQITFLDAAASAEDAPFFVNALNEFHRSAANGTLSPIVLASVIDHTLLRADATRNEIERICDEARRYGFASVCVNPSRISCVRNRLVGANAYPVAVVGFPLGANTGAVKAFETSEAIRNGAAEIDTVIAMGLLKERDYAATYADLRAVVDAAAGAPVKVILETSLLTTEEKIIACVIAEQAGAQFVKTSTGFGSAGATAEDVRLMRSVVGTRLKVKASGGIRTRADALKMIAAGADRIGASAGVLMIQSDPRSEKESGGY